MRRALQALPGDTVVKEKKTTREITTVFKLFRGQREKRAAVETGESQRAGA